MKMTSVVFMVLMMAVFTTAMGGEVYKVGDSAGWTHIGHVDYKSWAATKVFRVGDTVVFDYNKLFQNVARVSYTDFVTCNGSAPYSTFTTGNDSFQIKFAGHYFFICTVPGHCQAGQKVDIRVPVPVRSSPHRPSPAPIEPLPFPYPQPTFPPLAPEKPTPSQSPSPAPSRSSLHAPTQISSHAPSHSPLATTTQVPSPVLTQSPPPSISRSPSSAPSHSPVPTPTQAPSPALTQSPPPSISQSPSSAPSLPKDSPADVSPASGPAPHKNSGSQSVSNFKLWTMIMAVFCYLVGFSF